MREGGRKEQRNANNVIIGREVNAAKLRLIHVLEFAKLGELTTKGCALFDDIGRKLGRVISCNERT